MIYELTKKQKNKYFKDFERAIQTYDIKGSCELCLKLVTAPVGSVFILDEKRWFQIQELTEDRKKGGE